MEALQAVEKEENRLSNKYSNYRKNLTKNLDDLIEHVRSVKEGLCQDCNEEDVLTPLQLHVVSVCSKKIKDCTNKVALEHKELHTYVSKIGKAIDRNFTTDFSGMTQENLFTGESSELLNKAISEHFLRQGQVDVAEKLIREAGLTFDHEHKEPFMELNYILNECKEKNLEPALKWAISHHSELLAKGSSLEFKLHKLKFIDYLSNKRYKEALEYSKIFQTFPSHSVEIQRLMCCFAFIKHGLEKSPYADLMDPVNWLEITEHLAKDACMLLGLSKNSPLEVSVTAGCIAIPTLLQLRQVMQQRQVEGMWNSKEELPVEIDLGREFQYHSIFACPILRQSCGRSNPPMRLVCGHVISKDALQRLSHGNKLKCPYCPMEMDPREAKRIFF
ncbi:E3 ubiquitin-protein ligase RMND5A-like [Hydractinia symbiolongicarpus]|uniref:E3 ubiquitin-protein ligase RMND5A-like n=1 Tax=Hydractinia symbiolongicarpus TaxID=13093 RepID=UPI00254B04CB|nr:E3 ubiquitin-protein ligase RMND5A-like [Hydractinia symbiolongicarpus]